MVDGTGFVVGCVVGGGCVVGCVVGRGFSVVDWVVGRGVSVVVGGGTAVVVTLGMVGFVAVIIMISKTIVQSLLLKNM